MPDHVLCFASGPVLDFAGRLRALDGDVTTSLICRFDHLAKMVSPIGHRHLLVLPKEAPIEEVVTLARALHEVTPVTRIAACWEHDQDRAAAVGLDLGIATYDPETVRAVNDKVLMRSRLRAAGVDGTAASLVTDEADLHAFGVEHGYPFIVKPVAATGSYGVSVVREPEQVASALDLATRSYRGVTRTEAMVEQFHEGPQYSVEAFSEAGEHVVVAVTRKYSHPHTLVELGHVLPAPLDEPVREEIERYIDRLLTALGVEFGPTHTEVVLTADGPRVIETHLRLGGDDIFDLVARATGVDMVEAQVRQVLGHKVLSDIRATLAAQREPRAEAIWYASPSLAGTFVRMIEPTPEATGTAEVTALQEPGTDLTGLVGSFSRLAKARAHAPTAEAALAAARSAAEALSFDVRLAAPRHEPI